MVAKGGAQGIGVFAFGDGQARNAGAAPETSNVETGPIGIRALETVAGE